MADADRCVCCGEIVPEGRQVCPQCEIELQSKPDLRERTKNRRRLR